MFGGGTKIKLSFKLCGYLFCHGILYCNQKCADSHCKKYGVSEYSLIVYIETNSVSADKTEKL